VIWKQHHKLMSYTCDLFGFAVSDVTEIAERYYEVYGMILPVLTAASADKALGKLCGTLLGNELNSHSIFSSLITRLTLLFKCQSFVSFNCLQTIPGTHVAMLGPSSVHTL
jgi:hypothetical protein